MTTSTKIVSKLKYLAFPLGYLMYFVTKPSFGLIPAIVLSVIAIVSFWFLMTMESSRMLGKSIAYEVRAAINDLIESEYVLEIQRFNLGMVVRVFFIQSGVKNFNVFYSAITSRLEDAELLDYLWMLQITDLPSEEAIPDCQKKMNAQIKQALDQVRKEKKAGKNRQ